MCQNPDDRSWTIDQEYTTIPLTLSLLIIFLVFNLHQQCTALDTVLIISSFQDTRYFLSTSHALSVFMLRHFESYVGN